MADFGFVGASYTTRSIYQDAQECINFYPEIDPTKEPGGRGIVALSPQNRSYTDNYRLYNLTSAQSPPTHTC